MLHQLAFIFLHAAFFGSDAVELLAIIRSGDHLQMLPIVGFAAALSALKWWQRRSASQPCWDGRERRSGAADRRGGQAGGRRATDRKNLTRA